MADCVDLRISEERIVGLCPAWGGEIMAEITYVDGHGTGFATVHPQIKTPHIQEHGDAALEEDIATGEVERIPVKTDPDVSRPRLLSRSPEPAEHRKLEEAEIVVVGGAGLGNMEGFGLVRELAVAVGGEVAGTRPPVLLHWVDEDRLIGQTGKAVRPNLLFLSGPPAPFNTRPALRNQRPLSPLIAMPTPPYSRWRIWVLWRMQRHFCHC